MSYIPMTKCYRLCITVGKRSKGDLRMIMIGNEGLRKDGQNEKVQTGKKDSRQKIAVHSEEVEKEIS